MSQIYKTPIVGPPSGVTSVTGTPNQILASPTTGNVVLSLIGPYTPATYTAHSVLVGEGTSSIVAVGPGSTGQILQSKGAAADPAYTTATYPSTTTINQVLYSSSANVVGGITAGNDGVLISGNTGIPSWLANGTTGQVLTATTGSPPSWGSVVSGVSSVTGTANQILASPTTGNVVLSLIGPYTPATYTAHGVLVGEGTSSIVAVATSATSGVPLISQGAAADPAFGTAVVAGGGTGITSATAFSPICGGTTTTGNFQSASTGQSTSGFVLTSTGAASLPTWQAVAGASITIDGDTGSATGSTINLHGTPNSGSSVSFSASGATVNLNVTDAGSNTIIGLSAGNGSLTATDCTGIGKSVFHSLTSATNCTAVGFNVLNAFVGNDGATGIGTNALQAAIGQRNTAGGALSIGSASATSASYNSAWGWSTLANLLTGSLNVALGTADTSGAGSQYTGAESSNIVINSVGVTGDNNVLRIGNATGSGNGELSQAFIQGISGVTVSNAADVFIDTTTGQLGTVAAVGKPAWQVYLAANIPGVTGDGTNYQIVYDTVAFDVGSNYNAGTGTYTFPVSGIYQINITNLVYVSSGVNTSTIMQGQVNVNGSLKFFSCQLDPSGYGLTTLQSLVTSMSLMYEATAGDQMQIFIDLNLGTKNIGVGGTLLGCNFSGFLVQPS